VAKQTEISRRKFVASAVSTAAISALPTHQLLGRLTEFEDAPAQAHPERPGNPDWKEQGIENLSKSPHAKLRDVPVRAVTIQTGFWGQRREVNVTKSIPSMHDLLEANGRMNNFRRLVGKSQAAQSGPVYSDSDIYKMDRGGGIRAPVRRSSRASDHNAENDR